MTEMIRKRRNLSELFGKIPKCLVKIGLETEAVEDQGDDQVERCRTEERGRPGELDLLSNEREEMWDSRWTRRRRIGKILVGSWHLPRGLAEEKITHTQTPADSYAQSKARGGGTGDKQLCTNHSVSVPVHRQCDNVLSLTFAIRRRQTTVQRLRSLVHNLVVAFITTKCFVLLCYL